MKEPIRLTDMTEGQVVWVLFVEDDGVRIQAWTCAGNGKDRRITRGYSSMYNEVFPAYTTRAEALAAAVQHLGGTDA